MIVICVNAGIADVDVMLIVVGENEQDADSVCRVQVPPETIVTVDGAVIAILEPALSASGITNLKVYNTGVLTLATELGTTLALTITPGVLVTTLLVVACATRSLLPL